MRHRFLFRPEIRVGAGAFVCGEETALIASDRGKQGRTPDEAAVPGHIRLWGKPTLINNVETFANIPVIILKGAQWCLRIGTEKSKGTKVSCHCPEDQPPPALVEVPMGTTLRKIIFELGGGIPNGKKFKAAQTGGPPGLFDRERFDTPVDYESLQAAGSMMGSGGLDCDG